MLPRFTLKKHFRYVSSFFSFVIVATRNLASHKQPYRVTTKGPISQYVLLVTYLTRKKIIYDITKQLPHKKVKRAYGIATVNHIALTIYAAAVSWQYKDLKISQVCQFNFLKNISHKTIR